MAGSNQSAIQIEMQIGAGMKRRKVLIPVKPTASRGGRTFFQIFVPNLLEKQRVRLKKPRDKRPAYRT
jgi:hypothetical protein